MRIVALLFVILGVALAGGAIYVYEEHKRTLEAMAARQDTGPKTVKVVAAAVRLEQGHRINNENALATLQWVEWPENVVPEGTFSRFEDVVGEDRDNSRVVLRTIEAGELVLKTKLSGFDASSRVAALVSEGKRAVTIPINAVSGVGGLIAPGDRVDIFLTRSINNQLTTSVILQNVLVIATDQLSNRETDRTRVARTATVEVGPKDARRLALAQQVGRLSLTLIGMGGTEEIDTAPVQLQDLPDQPEVAAPQQQEQGSSVRVRRAGQVQETAVD